MFHNPTTISQRVIKTLFCLIVFYALHSSAQVKIHQIIPQPNNSRFVEGTFVLSEQTKISIPNASFMQDASYLANYFETQHQLKLEIVTNSTLTENCIRFVSAEQSDYGDERYELVIQPGGVNLMAAQGGAGFFYGIQTMLQSIPVAELGLRKKPLHVMCTKTQDQPRFSYRGMHLDVSRHFFSKTFIKKYLDQMAFYKFNTFHWHLTDDQGWRIEIKKYPLLTQVGAYRKGSMIGAYSDQKYDTLKYGGFYTQEEIKEIVAYAAKLHITVIPEIEMPGHSQAAIASYPWLSCRSEKIGTAKGWGVFEDVFCTKDTVFRFLEDVLSEVSELFPGPYIHIGGDECPKTRWKMCRQCQARMKTEGLKDENELQSYFIKRISQFLQTRNKAIIGWDEIMEGGLAPGATVMSWRGTQGGIEAAHQYHNAVMTPGSHCYFDHYQAQGGSEPIAIGGFTSLEKVYSFEPVPAELSAAESKFIKGAQANVWTEYISTEAHCEYMVNPRMAALAEVLWTDKGNKDESEFLRRIQLHFNWYNLKKINYAKALYNVTFSIPEPASTTEVMRLELNANRALGEIRYTLDGNAPDAKSPLYTQAIEFNKTMRVRAAVFSNGLRMGTELNREFVYSKSTNKAVTFGVPPSKYYNTGGGFTLVNGIQAGIPRINSEWLGWSGNDMEVVLALGNMQEVQEIECGFLNEDLNWIYFPKEVLFYTSEDGVDFKQVAKLNTAEILKQNRKLKATFKKQNAKYIKVVAKNAGKIASGKPGAGEDCWLFCDEININ